MRKSNGGCHIGSKKEKQLLFQAAEEVSNAIIDPRVFIVKKKIGADKSSKNLRQRELLRYCNYPREIA